MIRTVAALSLLALVALAGQPGHADTAVECESKTNGGDYYEITCPLSSEGTWDWRFRADFTGVHDDSGAYVTVRVDGQEVPCAPGSTIKLSGEGDEGSSGTDSFIECWLVLEGRAAAERQLFVVLTWKHAQHTGHELVAVPKR